VRLSWRAIVAGEDLHAMAREAAGLSIRLAPSVLEAISIMSLGAVIFHFASK
jgi:hypothetical protein